MHKAHGRFAGIELGGTKSIAVLGKDSSIVDRFVLPTTTAIETLGLLNQQLRFWQAEGTFAGLGIASFGPLRLDPVAADFGRILATPKPGWADACVLATLANDLRCPTEIDTDVNAAALAEYHWGHAQGCSSVVYLTIGTGLGGGILVEGRPLHGRLHPEIGHILTRRAATDAFPGVCRFHGDCIEGLISGPALERRFGKSPADLSVDAPQWEFVTHDLAQLLAILIHSVSPQRILIGGGVGIGAAHLLPQAILKVRSLLGNYYPQLDLPQLSLMIQTAALAQDAGPMGAIALAHDAWRRTNSGQARSR
ncbi:MAG: ROK family protein [Sphingomicrobium sp.]